MIVDRCPNISLVGINRNTEKMGQYYVEYFCNTVFVKSSKTSSLAYLCLE